MRVAFRADASLLIGSGHVMRCLTLADALRTEGAHCHFISREHPGHLLDLIRQRGFAVTPLPPPAAGLDPGRAGALVHAPWLGCDWQTDVQQSGAALAQQPVDWLVVDHYALDQSWEVAMRSCYRKLLAIDDLADRAHQADLLLDQNLGREPRDYAAWVPPQCQVLTGPRHALLRPEFAAWRSYSLQRRQQPSLRNLLISMGGVDLPNATGQVLQALRGCALPQDGCISVVMGAQSPWLRQVREQARDMPLPTEVLVNITDMARRMADSDLALGAAGGTSWERCCLGVPTLLVVLAENQRPGADALRQARAAGLIGDVDDIATQLPPAMQALAQGLALARMGHAASALSDGQGTRRLLRAMEVVHE